VRQLLEDHGVKVHTLTSGPMKGVGSPFSDLTDENKDYLMNTLIMSMYHQFVAVVQEGRPKIAKDRLEQLADGRAYNADQALKEGLIDQIGFFDEAVALAAKRAGLAEPKVIQYERRSGLFDLLASASQAQSQTILHTTPDVLNAWTTPQVMLLWRGQ
jgi:protease-4